MARINKKQKQTSFDAEIQTTFRRQVECKKSCSFTLKSISSSSFTHLVSQQKTPRDQNPQGALHCEGPQSRDDGIAVKSPFAPDGVVVNFGLNFSKFLFWRHFIFSAQSLVDAPLEVHRFGVVIARAGSACLTGRDGRSHR